MSKGKTEEIGSLKRMVEPKPYLKMGHCKFPLPSGWCDFNNLAVVPGHFTLDLSETKTSCIKIHRVHENSIFSSI